MQTNFFSNLKSLGLKNLTLAITFSEDNSCIVSVLSKPNSEDPAFKTIPPFNIKESSAEEIDEQFFNTLNKPMKMVKNVFDNTEEFEKSLKDAESKSKVKKAVKEKTSNAIKKLSELIDNKNFNPLHEKDKAIKLANDILELSPTNKKAKEVLKSMASYNVQTLF